MTRQQEIPAEEVARALERVLARPEFQESEPSALERLLSWLAGLFEALPISEAMAEGLGWALLWVLGVAVLVLLVLAFQRVGRRGPDRRATEAEVARVAERVAGLRARAERARAEGDRLLALRFYFFALVVGLGRKGDLEYHDSWTNRELLERGRPSAEVARELGPLVSELDHKMFGAGETSEGDLERLSALCDRWLGAPPGLRTGPVEGAERGGA